MGSRSSSCGTGSCFNSDDAQEDKSVALVNAYALEEETVVGRDGSRPFFSCPMSSCGECKSSKGPCRLRIIAVNDIYKLDNLPRLKTLVAEEAANTEHNLITTLAGDFLAPYLLSSIDSGCGMVRMLNRVPVDMVCFGNHEADIPYPKLVQRIQEFSGTWLNSNMPDFKPKLPSTSVRELVGLDGRECARKVAFAGFCIGGGKFSATYREGAFGGAAQSMVPVLESAPMVVKAVKASHPDIDAIIPITHQDMPEDTALAEMNLFPVVVAGHDHDVMQEKHGPGGCHVIKAGMDASNAAVIDLVWGDDDSAPQVSVDMRDLKAYKEDPEMMAAIEKINSPVRELESAMLYEISAGEELSSEGVKYHDATMARKVADAIRDCLDCDCAILNSGAVRGNKDYATSRCISYGDLKKECPYPSPIVVAPMPFEVLKNAVRESRQPWKVAVGEKPKEATSALQCDNGVMIDKTTEEPITIAHGNPDDPNKLYSVACDTRVLKKNKVLAEYCAKFPDRIPPDDAGRPVLPILVEFFCGQIWHRLLDTIVGGDATAAVFDGSKAEKIFELFDADHSGLVDSNEVAAIIKDKLGPNLSSRIIVEQMITMVDLDGDGKISHEELLKGMKKIFHEHH